MKIYFSRHGESVNNTKNIIGGDCCLSENGRNYSNNLKEHFKDTKDLKILTSKLKRTIETVEKINAPKEHIEELNEIYAGDFENFDLDFIRKEYYNIYTYRNEDKINRSYPNGESYNDLQKRVNKVLEKIDLNKDGTLLIISHKAVSRIIYSFFTKTKLDPNLKIELNILYGLETKKFRKLLFV
jgi:broad specificity phosphatase PhoE